MKKQRRCANEICLYTSYGQEENFWSRRKLSKNAFSWLCQLCTEAYKKNQYCDFCKQIYFDGNSEITDGKEWVQCEQCFKWNHPDCEVTRNGNEELQHNLTKDDFKYYCLSCSKGKKSFKPKIEASADASMAEPEEETKRNPALIDEEAITPFTQSTPAEESTTRRASTRSSMEVAEKSVPIIEIRTRRGGKTSVAGVAKK